MYSSPEIVGGSDVEMMYCFDGATNNYSTVLIKRGENISTNRGEHYSFNAKDLKHVRNNIGSCVVDIEPNGKGVFSADRIKVKMMTPEVAFDFNEHLKRSQSMYSGYVEFVQ